MTLRAATKLAVLVRDIPEENIKHAVIDNSMITFGSTVLGGQRASVIRPISDKIRILRDEIFTARGALSPMAEGELTSLMKADEPRLRILNGTSSPELDQRTARYLRLQGITVPELGDTRAQSRTTIVLYTPKLYALQYLIEIFEISRSVQILIQPDPSQTVDIEVRLGPDWVDNLPTE